MRVNVHRRTSARVCVELAVTRIRSQHVVVNALVLVLVVIWDLAVLSPLVEAVVSVSLAVHIRIIRLVDSRRPSVFADWVVNLWLESASATILASRNYASLAVFVHHPHADGAGQTPEEEDDDAKADGRFGDFALAHATPGPGLALALFVCVLVVGVVFCSLLDALRLPDADRDGGCEPEKGEEEIEAEVGVDAGETPRASPHRNHDLVDQGGDTEEALWRVSERQGWCHGL